MTDIFEQYMISTNPTGYWRLEELSGGTAQDSSGNANHGNYVNVARGYPSGIPATPDSYGGNFQNSGHRVTIPGFRGKMNSANWSMGCWFRATSSYSNWPRIMGAFDFNVSGISFVMNRNNGAIFAEGHAAGHFGFGGTPAYWDGNWHFLVLTQDNNTLNLYGDGNNYGTTTRGGLVTYPGQDLTLGTHATETGDDFIGQIDEAAWWDRTLTPQEIQDIYDVGMLTKTLYTISGTVTVGGVHSRRQINIHNRETGRLVGTGYSEEDGTYSIPVATDEECYVVIMEDKFNQKYESRVKDFAIPVPV